MSQPTTYFYHYVPIQYEATDLERQQILSDFPSPELPNSNEFFDRQSEAPGNYVKARLLLNEYSIQLTKTGKQFLKLMLQQQFGRVLVPRCGIIKVLSRGIRRIRKFFSF